MPGINPGVQQLNVAIKCSSSDSISRSNDFYHQLTGLSIEELVLQRDIAENTVALTSITSNTKIYSLVLGYTMYLLRTTVHNCLQL